MIPSVVQLIVAAAPDDEDVVAGWTAFAIFGLLALAVVVLGFSLTKRLKNVDRAADAGLYDPSDPKRGRDRPARGLAAAREVREQQRQHPDDER
jgi:hypothetical protein